jgi:flagellar biosynthetic protein FlhB
MAEESFKEKTEKPTPRKRRDVRKKGEVARSRELPSVAVLLSAIITLTFFGSYMYSHVQIILKGAFTHTAMNDLCIPEYFIIYAQETITRYLVIIGPLIAAVFLTAIFSNILQVGFMMSGELIKPKLSKLNPLKGFGKLLSKQSFMELFKTLLKLSIIGAVAYYTIRREIVNIPFIGEMDLKTICMYILSVTFKIFIRCTLAMIILVVIDYAFQKWEFEKRIKMTKQEVKDEFKKTEGDPLVKSRIKNIQMEMARKRMMQAVPHADVVITNPTRLAVAIKYDSAAMNAPKLLAKGAERIAKKIKDLAEKHEIPIIENKELAQSLYMMVEIGQEVPPLLYQAIAEVLAYIYKLRGHTVNELK